MDTRYRARAAHRAMTTPPVSTLAPIALLVAALGAPHPARAQPAAAEPAAEPKPGTRQTAPPGGASAPADTVMPTVRARATADTATGKETLRATQTSIGKGEQALRDVPQSVTVVTERLIDDRNLDTLKDVLRNTAGIAFQAAEGGEEDIRLRGFSLQGSGDIFIDGMRDPAFYERDSFNWDRLELLRGSASMLFGRGSTGGAVNQVSKQPMLNDEKELAVTLGTRGYVRTLGDFNVKTGDTSAVRVNAMWNVADNDGAGIDKRGIAPTLRWGIGTRHEFSAGLYYLRNDNGIHYGLPWLTPGAGRSDYVWRTDPKNYYGMASDYNRTGTTQGNFTHLFRMDDGAQIRTAVRVAQYERDQRASAIRFAAANLQPGGKAVTSDTFSPSTVLTRGTNLKFMDMKTVYLQSDYSGRHRWGGVWHSVQAGVDFASEDFENSAAVGTPGASLAKPSTTVGTPNDGARIDESSRVMGVNRTFRARSLGAYAQDLIMIAPSWKVLAGLRWDRFEGTYDNLTIAAAANNPCSVTPATRIQRSDSLLSQRLGLLFQPTAYQSWHLSYGTSYNTAGDAYQYDAGTAKVDPEKSRNFELGGRIDSENGRLTTRVALFHSTKYNERNRDADSVDACNYVLSGQRHAAGLEFDVAGRITPKWEVFASYAFIPVARVDQSSGAAGAEPVGSRPGLTPRHTASAWTTYRIDPMWRIGGGITARSADKPVGLAVGSEIEAPQFVTADLMVERAFDNVTIKANLINVANRHYADTLYRGHYIPGVPRTLQVTAIYRF